MTQPGVGPITSLAFVVTLGDVSRFQRGKQVASYLGLIPSEHSSGSKRRLGAISKQGNVFMRTLLVEAAQSAVRHDQQFRQTIPAPLPSKAHRRGQGGDGSQAGGTALLDAAHPDAVSRRSFTTRATRVIPWSANLSQTVHLNGYPRIPHRRDVRKSNHGRSSRPHRWLVERFVPPKMIRRENSRDGSGLNHADRVAFRSSTHSSALDNAFRFIDGMTNLFVREICDFDRSVTEWRDLRFSSSILRHVTL